MSAVNGKDVAVAACGLLNVAPTVNALRMDEIQATPPTVDYCEVSAFPRDGGAPSRMGGFVSVDSWRIAVRVVGKYEQNAQTLMQRTRTRLEHALLVVGAVEGQISRVETADPVAPDDSWWSSLMTFTVTL